MSVDRFAACAPDALVDLEILPWPWENDSVEEMPLSHALAHLGAASDAYLGVVREMYRVCRDGARLQ